MSLSFINKKRIRKSFGKIPTISNLPNLVEVQKRSFDSFLQLGVEPGKRLNHGLHEVFRTVFPINDYTERATVDFCKKSLYLISIEILSLVSNKMEPFKEKSKIFLLLIEK